MNTITLKDGTVVRKTPSGELVATTPEAGRRWEMPDNSFVLDMFRRLVELSWVPVTERLPTEEESNEYGDVDWSDGKDIWEAHYSEPREATHWRRIVLP